MRAYLDGGFCVVSRAAVPSILYVVAHILGNLPLPVEEFPQEDARKRAGVGIVGKRSEGKRPQQP